MGVIPMRDLTDEQLDDRIRLVEAELDKLRHPGGVTLTELLHPEDPTTIPQPGFPSFEGLVAWAEAQPREEVVDEAIEVLLTGGWPQQYAAMGLLRRLGVEVDGEGHHEDFRWVVQLGEGLVISRPQE